ncbi:MAG TPA: M48 family metalloprotease [Blastocatellia bacterium]
MLTLPARLALVITILFSMVGSGSAYSSLTAGGGAQSQDADTSQKNQKDKNKDKKDKDSSDDSSQTTKQDLKYLEMKKFSEELYASDPGFRQEVDEAYSQKVREHSEFAFDINTRLAIGVLTDQGARRPVLVGRMEEAKGNDILYDNPLVQDYVNRVGHSIVPANSTHLYAFKVTLNPIPEARSLSTGTIYVSSGLLSVIDNEAQLAYVLGHEVAHIEKEHWHEDILIARGIERYNDKQARKRGIIGAAAGPVLGLIGQHTSVTSVLEAGLLASYYMPTLLKILIPNSVLSWDKSQEDEADRLGLKYMFDRNYDPREVPKFYANLRKAAARDPRLGLGFMAEATRIRERTEQVGQVISTYGISPASALMVGATSLASPAPSPAPTGPTSNAPQPGASAQGVGKTAPQGQGQDTGKQLDPSRDADVREVRADIQVRTTMSAELKAKLDSGDIIGSSSEFEAVMAELKRDNGIRALYFDMFQFARDNLEQSIQIRSNDPLAHLFYGRVLKLTARNATEKSHALAELKRAIELDRRFVLPDCYLHQALAEIEVGDGGQPDEIASSLKRYIEIYQQEHKGALPDNMAVIYDYLQEQNDVTWAARPADNVSTKNLDPLTIASATTPKAPEPAAQPESDSRTEQTAKRKGRR